MPSHSHVISTKWRDTWSSSGSADEFNDVGYDKSVTKSTNNTGSSSSHTHTLSGTASIALNVKYTDVIICSKN